MGLNYDKALAICGFIKSGGKWSKDLKLTDENGFSNILFQPEGRTMWSVDLIKGKEVKTESARKLKGTLVYPLIEAELKALDETVDALKLEPAEPENDPLDNLKECGFELEQEPGNYPVESFLEPVEDNTPSNLKWSDAELIEKINAILWTVTPEDKVYGVVKNDS